MMFPNYLRLLEVQVGGLDLQAEILDMMYELLPVATAEQSVAPIVSVWTWPALESHISDMEYELRSVATEREFVHVANIELAETMMSMGFIDTIEAIVN